MKAVICMLHSSYVHSGLAPWYLLAGVKEHGLEGITVEVAEGTVNIPVEDAAELIVSKKPRAIGFCCYIWNISFIKKLLPAVKEALPGAVIILGGPEVSFNASRVLRELPLADYVISGEGEKPFALLLNAIYSGRDAGDIPGVCLRAKGVPKVKAPYLPDDIPPCPYGEEYFKALGGRIAYLETSRGCPFKCAFCLSGRDTSVRFFPIERAKREMALLAGSGTRTVKLVDRTFNSDRQRAQSIFKYIIDNCGTLIPRGVCFHFEIAGDLLDFETFELLKTAPPGLLQFEIGLQSFNAGTLEAIDRRTDIKRLKSNIERLISYGNIHIHVDLIAGLPYEDMDVFSESFNTAYALKPHMLQLGFLKLLHGSAMRENPDRFPCSFSSEPPYMVTGTPWLAETELERLHGAEAALNRLYNSGRFRRTLEYVLAQAKIMPFELFMDAGRIMAERIKNGISLDDLTALSFEYFCSFKGVDKIVLRDHMVCDRLATNASGRLPVSLCVPDKRLKRIALKLGQRKKTADIRGIAILYSENAAVRADYCKKDPVTGEYQLTKHHLD